MLKERYCAWCKDPMDTESVTCPRCGADCCDDVCLDAHLEAYCQKKAKKEK